jgi:hypothetical protein
MLMNIAPPGNHLGLLSGNQRGQFNGRCGVYDANQGECAPG